MDIFTSKILLLKFSRHALDITFLISGGGGGGPNKGRRGDGAGAVGNSF